MTANYGVSVVILIYESLSATVITVSYVTWWYIRPDFNCTWLYMELRCIKRRILWQYPLLVTGYQREYEELGYTLVSAGVLLGLAGRKLCTLAYSLLRDATIIPVCGFETHSQIGFMDISWENAFKWMPECPFMICSGLVPASNESLPGPMLT